MKFCPRCGYFVNREKDSCPKCGYNSVKPSPSRISGTKTGIVVSLIAIVIVAILFTTFPSTNNFDDSQLIDSDTEFEIPLDTKVPVKSNNQLIQFALKQVNDDREKHGVPPVKLGNNPSAQAHADDMLEHNYFSHWNSDGVKPYVTYTQLGGKGNVAENISFTESYCPTFNCLPNSFNPKSEIEDHQYAMVYDDAESDWGHRDNILDPYQTHVNFGVAYDDENFYYVQHFEKNIIRWDRIELTDNNILYLDGELLPGFVFREIYIYEDPNPKQLTGSILNNEEPYNLGYYDQGKLVGSLVKPLGSNAFYKECNDGTLRTLDEQGVEECVEYEIYNEYEKTTNHFSLNVDVSKWMNRDGLHSIYVFIRSLETFDDFPAASITLEHL